MYILCYYSTFVNLARSIVINEGQQPSVGDFRTFFPDFLWLLRDVHLTPTNSDGKPISATEFLKTQILIQGDSFFETASDTVARAILAFFPTVECHILPPPSDNPEVMKDISKRSDELSRNFHEGVEELIECLKKKIPVKKGFHGGPLNGSLIAAVARKYTEAINDPDAIPTIKTTWEIVVSSRIESMLQELVLEYEQEMEEEMAKLQEIPALEEEHMADSEDAAASVMGLHRKILAQKVSAFLDFLSFIDFQEGEEHVKSLENAIVEYQVKKIEDDEGRHIDKKIVTGGVLNRFVTENYKKSQKFCSNLFDSLHSSLNNTLVQHESFMQAMEELEALHKQYFKQACGPAKWEVYNEKRCIIEEEKEKLKQLKDYENQLEAAAEEKERVQTENLRLAEEIESIRLQMIHDNEMHKQTLVQVQQAQMESLLNAQREAAKQKALEEQKHQEFLQANMARMAKQAESNCQALKDKEHAFMQMVQVTQTNQIKAMEELTKAMAADPPPPPLKGITINHLIGIHWYML